MTEFEHLREMFSVRWKLVVIIALVGMLGAVFVANWRNGGIRERFEAVAAITVVTGEESNQGRGNTDQSLEQARILAVEANEALINERTSVRTSKNGLSLEFVAVRASASEAVEKVESMRTNYINASPAALGGGFDAEDLLAEAQAIETNIDALRPPEPSPPPEPSVEQQVQVSLLNGELAALEARASQLAVEMVGDLEAEEREAAEAEMTRINSRLIELNSKLDTLDVPSDQLPGGAAKEELDPFAGLPLGDRWRATALQNRLTALQTQFEDTFVSEISEGQLIVAAPTFSEITPAPISPVLAGILALIGSTILASGVLILLDRIRRPIWAASEMHPVPVIAELPVSHRPLSASRTEERRRAIRLIREDVMSAERDGGVTVGFVGVGGTGQEAVADVSYRVAASFTESGRSVLLIDAQGAPGNGFPGLARLRGDIGDSATEIAEKVNATISEVAEVSPGLHLLGGTEGTDTFDIMAGKPFRQFLGVVRDRFDAVMVLGQDDSAASAGVLGQMVDRRIVVATRGRSTRAALNHVLSQFTRSDSELNGAVLLSFLRGRPQLKMLWRIRSWWRGRRAARVRENVRPVTVDLHPARDSNAP